MPMDELAVTLSDELALEPHEAERVLPTKNQFIPLISSEPLTELGITHTTRSVQSQPGLLRHNFSWVFLGNMTYAGCNWLMSVSLAKMGTVIDVGQYSTGVALTQPAITFSMLMLRGVLATDTRNAHKFGTYLALRLVTTLCALFVLAGIALASPGKTDTRWVVLATSLGVCFDAISDIFHGLLQRSETMKPMGISLGAKGILSLTLLIVGYQITHSVVGGVLGSALASLLILCFYDLPNGVKVARKVFPQDWITQITPHFDGRELLNLGITAFPLGLTVMLTTLTNYTSRLFVVQFEGQSQMGIFSAMTLLLNVGSTALLSMGAALTPRLSQYYTSGRVEDFTKLTVKFTALAGLVGAIALIASAQFGKSILTFFFKSEYAARPDVFVVLMLAGTAFYLSLAFGNSLTAARAFRVQAWAAAAVTVVSIASAWILVPHYGLMGAAVSTLLAMATRLFLVFVLFTFVLSSKKRTLANLGHEIRP